MKKRIQPQEKHRERIVIQEIRNLKDKGTLTTVY